MLAICGRLYNVVVTLILQNYDVCLWQSTTPDKPQMGTAAGKHNEKTTPQKASPASSSSRPSSSAKRLGKVQTPKSMSPSKRVQSSAVKRLRYMSGPESEKNGNGSVSSDFKLEMNGGLQPITQSLTTAMQVSPLHGSPGTMNGTAAGSSHDIAQNKSPGVKHGSPEVKHRSPDVKSKLSSTSWSPDIRNKSPKGTSRSPKVTSRTQEVNRSPRHRMSASSDSVKHGSLESPAGQPKTKKFIVERLRNAKTSRKKTVDAAAGSRSSPSRKSPQKCSGKLGSVFVASPLSYAHDCMLFKG